MIKIEYQFFKCYQIVLLYDFKRIHIMTTAHGKSISSRRFDCFELKLSGLVLSFFLSEYKNRQSEIVLRKWRNFIKIPFETPFDLPSRISLRNSFSIPRSIIYHYAEKSQVPPLKTVRVRVSTVKYKKADKMPPTFSKKADKASFFNKKSSSPQPNCKFKVCSKSPAL